MDQQRAPLSSEQAELRHVKTRRPFWSRRGFWLLAIPLILLIAITGLIFLQQAFKPVDYGPPATTGMNTLNGVSAISANDIWAVGDHSSYYRGQTLTEHWDGKQWSIIPSPNMNTGNNYPDYYHDIGDTLTAVKALSHDNVWAVGYTYNMRRVTPLIEHWDGNRWRAAGFGHLTETPPDLQGRFYAITALSANNIWAVGSTFSRNGTILPVIGHWDGTGWDISTQADCGQKVCILRTLTAISDHDIWAAGYSAQSTRLPADSVIFDQNLYSIDIRVSPGIKTTPFIEHWDGKSWHVISAPAPSTLDARIFSLSANTPNDIWGVGRIMLQTPHQKEIYYSSQPLIVHWNGTRWEITHVPMLPPEENTLTAISIVAPNNVWAVGYSGNKPSNDTSSKVSSNYTLLEHWDGNSWHTFYNNIPDGASPLPPGGIAAFSASDIWVVNSSNQAISVSFTNGAPILTRFDHWNGHNWHSTYGPNAPGSYPFLPQA